MGDFVIRRWELEPCPGDQAPPHVHHRSDEAFCVVEGLLDVRLGDERRRRFVTALHEAATPQERDQVWALHGSALAG